MSVVSRSEAETRTVARALVQRLDRNAIVLLTGDLGAGKTAFVKGLAEGLGVPASDVSSPTFTLIQEYRGGRLTLYHIDLYRLSPPEVDDLGLDELVSSGGIVAIEWPDRWRDVPDEVTRVTIAWVADDERTISIDGPPAR